MPTPAPARRPELAVALDLEPHPEGGWYRRTWRGSLTVKPPGYDGERPSATGIYYLLGPGERSAWHQVCSDELWLHHQGVPLVLRLGGSGEEPGEVVEEQVLGADLAAGQRPQVLVPARRWQSAQPLVEGTVLVSCVVSPGFDFADWRELPA